MRSPDRLHGNLKPLLFLTLLLMFGAIGASVLLTSQMNTDLPEPWRRQSFFMSVVVPAVISPPIWAIIAWILIKNDRLLKRVDQLANFDPLTGLYNRRAFFEYGSREIALAMQSPCPNIAIAMVDLDHFKELNDAHGHAAGDCALVGLSNLMSECKMPRVTIGRLGGDEFAFLCAGFQEDAVHENLKRFETSLAAPTLATASGEPLLLSASVGIATATLRRDAVPEIAIDKLLADADAALYVSKREGRNRISFAA